MNNSDYIFKSQFPIKNIFAFNTAAVYVIFLYYIYSDYYAVKILTILTPFLNYILLSLLYYIFYFYEDRVVRVFVFRPFRREKVFYYEQFISVTFQHIGYQAYADWAKFNISLKPHKRRFFLTFTIRKRAKRVEITKFLLSKGIEMCVLSSFRKRDQEIINLVWAKYPKNVRVDIV